MIGIPPPTAASNRKGTPLAGGGLEQLGSPGGDQCLVGGDDRLAGPQRPQHQVPGDTGAAHHLDDQVDVGVIDQIERPIGQHPSGTREGPLLVEVGTATAPHLEVEARLGLDRVVLVDEPPHQAAPDGACAESDANREAQPVAGWYPCDRPPRLGRMRHAASDQNWK